MFKDWKRQSTATVRVPRTGVVLYLTSLGGVGMCINSDKEEPGKTISNPPGNERAAAQKKVVVMPRACRVS